MFKSSLEICSQGYNIEQTDYYIASLENRIAFAENAYADAVNRIKALETQNALLTSELNSRIALIADKLDVELPTVTSLNESEDELSDSEAEEIENAVVETFQSDELNESQADEDTDESDEEYDNLKSQIDELKSLFENN